MMDKFALEIAKKLIAENKEKEVETLVKCTMSLLSGDMSIIKRTPDEDVKALHVFFYSIIMPNLEAMPNVTKIVLPNPDFCNKCANFKQNYKSYTIFCLKTELLSTGGILTPSDSKVLKIDAAIPRKCPLKTTLISSTPNPELPISNTVH